MAEESGSKTQFTVLEAMQIALQGMRRGEFEQAKRILDHILEHLPDYPDALHFRGMLSVRQREFQTGIPMIERSLELAPHMSEWRNNLGNAYYGADRFKEAHAQYTIALGEGHDDPNAWSNLGQVERLLGNKDAAEAAFRKALDFMPDHTDALAAFAHFLHAQDRYDEEKQYLFRLIELLPNKSGAPRALLARIYTAYGESEKARKVLEEWLIAEPENPRARHYLAALTGDGVPTRADDAYVSEVFDEFASSFDRHLDHLGYKAPSFVAEALGKALGEAGGALVGLDAGCGTGLCGPLVRAHFGRLDGVDLSPRMMEIARERAVYDALIEGELTAFIASRPSTYDVILSADTLCYFGSLEDVSAAVAVALNPGGIFIFTVEQDVSEAETVGYRLQEHGRYCHREDYVRHALRQAKPSQIDIDYKVLRYENSKPVHGLVVTALWPGARAAG